MTGALRLNISDIYLNKNAPAKYVGKVNTLERIYDKLSPARKRMDSYFRQR